MNQRSKLAQSMQDFRWLVMALGHCFAFATILAAKFGCDRCRIMPEIVSKLMRIAI